MIQRTKYRMINMPKLLTCIKLFSYHITITISDCSKQPKGYIDVNFPVRCHIQSQKVNLSWEGYLVCQILGMWNLSKSAFY